MFMRCTSLDYGYIHKKVETIINKVLEPKNPYMMAQRLCRLVNKHRELGNSSLFRILIRSEY